VDKVQNFLLVKGDTEQLCYKWLNAQSIRVGYVNK